MTFAGWQTYFCILIFSLNCYTNNTWWLLTFGERYKEHLKTPSPIYDHYNITGHETSIENFSIVGREDQNLIRAIKEAIYIRVNSPSLNRNIGKYHLPHILDEVLLNNPELKLK